MILCFWIRRGVQHLAPIPALVSSRRGFWRSSAGGKARTAQLQVPPRALPEALGDRWFFSVSCFCHRRKVIIAVRRVQRIIVRIWSYNERTEKCFEMEWVCVQGINTSQSFSQMPNNPSTPKVSVSSSCFPTDQEKEKGQDVEEDVHGF